MGTKFPGVHKYHLLVGMSGLPADVQLNGFLADISRGGAHIVGFHPIVVGSDISVRMPPIGGRYQ